MNNPPAQTYSARVLESRASLLNAAAQNLLDYDNRKDYDQDIRYSTAHVAVDKTEMPGALVVLQECGEHEAVIQLGERLLRDNFSALELQDMATVIALAYCDLASILINRGDGVSESYKCLERAAGILKLHDGSTPLLTKINDTLQELTPGYIVEQLSLTMSPDVERHGEKRNRAMDLLKSVLWLRDSASSVIKDRAEFLKRVHSFLSAAEQIQVYEAAPEGARVPAEELYDVGLAFLAEGYRRRWPAYVLRADALFEAVGGAAAGLQLSIERSICALLLGNTAEARTLLHAARDAPASGDDEDEPNALVAQGQGGAAAVEVVGGTQSMAATWLQDAVLANFRETADMPVDLHHWFGSPEVYVYLQLLKNSTSRKVLQAFEAIKDTSAHLLHDVTSLAAAAVRPMSPEAVLPPPPAALAGAADAAALPPAPPPPAWQPLTASLVNGASAAAGSSTSADLNGAGDWRRRAGEQGSVVGGPWSQPLQPSLNSSDEDELPMDRSISIGEMMRRQAEAEARRHGGSGGGPGRESGAEDPSPDVTTTALSVSHAETAITWQTPAGAGGEDKKRTLLQKLLVAAAVLVGGAALCAAYVRQHRYYWAWPPWAAGGILAQQGVVAGGLLLDVRGAQALLAQWQRAKAAALGPERRSADLPAWLCGDALAQWRRQCRDDESARRYVEVQRSAVFVTAVERGGSGDGGGVCWVEASVSEAGRVVEWDGFVRPYDNTVTLEYKLLLEWGRWKISSIATLPGTVG